MLGLKHEVLMKKRMEITFFKLENKHKKQLGEGKMDSTFKRTYYLATFKGRWRKW
jgi:hypothetical protein